MKLVALTAADVERLKKVSPAATSFPTLHHEELIVDDVAFGLARPGNSADHRTNTYSITFRCGDTDYLILVRPTVHDVPSITLNVIRKGAGEGPAAQFASYSLLKDTLTTLRGEISTETIAPAEGHPKGALATLDFQKLLAGLKVQ
jgi:hypothetical protein